MCSSLNKIIKLPLLLSLCLLRKWTYLHKNFSKRSWVNVHFKNYWTGILWRRSRSSGILQIVLQQWDLPVKTDNWLKAARVQRLWSHILCSMFSEKTWNVNRTENFVETDNTGTIKWLPGSGYLQQINVHFICRSILDNPDIRYIVTCAIAAVSLTFLID